MVATKQSQIKSYEDTSWNILHFFLLFSVAHAVFSLECLSMWLERERELSPAREQYLWGTQPSQCPPGCSLIQPSCHPEASLSKKLWINPPAQAKFPLIHRDPQNFQQSNRTKIFHILHFESISHLQYNGTTIPRTWSPEDACVFISIDRNTTRISAIFPKSTPTDVDCCLTSYGKTRKLCKTEVKKSEGGL